MQKKVSVAVALIVKQGEILLGWRDEHLHQGGCFEFPGGKVDAGESPEQAVLREVQEEVGIDVQVVKLFQQLEFDYVDRHLQLYFYLCHMNNDVLLQNHWRWIAFDQLSEFSFPAANQLIIARLAWSRYLAIVPDQGEYQFKPEMNLCYLRGDQLSIAQLAQLNENSARQYIVRWQVYQTLVLEIQQRVFAIHLNAQQLHQLTDLTQFQAKNVIAACHTAHDIAKANQLGCDAILLSPVLPTATHPEAQGMGWQNFAELAVQAQMPVYALGGMQMAQLALAQHYGAYGVAGIRDFVSG